MSVKKLSAVAVSLCFIFGLIWEGHAWKRAAKPTGDTITEKAGEKKEMDSDSLDEIVWGTADIIKSAAKLSHDELNFVRGYANFRTGNWKDADEFLKKTLGKFPVINDHIIYYRAVAANRLSRCDEALALLDEFKTGHSDSVWMDESLIERGRALICLGKYAQARRELTSYKRNRDGEKGFDADILIAKSFIEEDSGSEAASFLRSIAISAGSEEKLKNLDNLILDLKKKFRVDISRWLGEPAQTLRLAESFAGNSQWDEAAARIEGLLKNKEISTSLEIEAKWLLARCYRWIHRYDEAIALMEKLKENPDAAGFRENLLNTLATTYTKKNEYEKAIALRSDMMERAPGSAYAGRMAFKIAFLYMDEGKYEEAIGQWRQALRLGGENRMAGEWYLAWCHFKAGKFREAHVFIDSMLRGRGKKSKIHDRLLYWKGRMLEYMGENAAARGVFDQVIRMHPYGYYAELSLRRLRGDKRGIGDFAEFGGNGEIKGRLNSESNVPASSNVHIKRAIVFDKMGLREEAGREIKSSGIASDDVIGLAAKNFAHDVAFRIAEGRYKNILQGAPENSKGFEKFVWEWAYPRAYNPVVMNLLEGSPVDPFVVWSIMRNESAFKPEVVSPAGAVGLMQLMPTTAARLSREAGKNVFDRRELYQPASNISFGISYLRKLARIFPENPVAWIASYNAGEEAVERWIKNGHTRDMEEWIEEIPYDETNLYVKKVLVSCWKYQRLYKN